MRVRAEKLKSDEVFGVNLVDPSNTKNLSGQFTSVQRRGDGGFAGTLDLTKGSAFGITRQVINAMGESANFGARVTIRRLGSAWRLGGELIRSVLTGVPMLRRPGSPHQAPVLRRPRPVH